MFNVPFAVWIMRDFFQSLPTDLEESALVDGATAWQAFSDRCLEHTGLVSVAIFSFVPWNEFIPLMLITPHHYLPC
jgi:ABC-type glycerol-3-phosphate transport system permease component